MKSQLTIVLLFAVVVQLVLVSPSLADPPDVRTLQGATVTTTQLPQGTGAVDYGKEIRGPISCNGRATGEFAYQTARFSQQSNARHAVSVPGRPSIGYAAWLTSIAGAFYDPEEPVEDVEDLPAGLVALVRELSEFAAPLDVVGYAFALAVAPGEVGLGEPDARYVARDRKATMLALKMASQPDPTVMCSTSDPSVALYGITTGGESIALEAGVTPFTDRKGNTTYTDNESGALYVSLETSAQVELAFTFASRVSIRQLVHAITSNNKGGAEGDVSNAVAITLWDGHTYAAELEVAGGVCTESFTAGAAPAVTTPVAATGGSWLSATHDDVRKLTFVVADELRQDATMTVATEISAPTGAVWLARILQATVSLQLCEVRVHATNCGCAGAVVYQDVTGDCV